MASEPKTIEVEPGSELDRLLAEAEDTPLRLVRHGVRFRLDREGEDIWANYDPEAARQAMLAAAGTWTALDAEALRDYVYRGREEGTPPLDRP